MTVRFDSLTIYDDTVVKNGYREALGTLVIIHGEYNSRLVSQSVASDTTAETFIWILDAYREPMGRQSVVATVKQGFPNAGASGI